MDKTPLPITKIPEIMAPAGDQECFLAALAAGADGIYLGLKNFSARMQAKNFALAELARLVDLAHAANCRVYVAMNNLIKQAEIEQAYRLARRLAREVMPDGLIIQDPGMLNLARQADFGGEIILSTLANITSASGLAAARDLGASRVVLPRELSIDELKILGANCPSGLRLECFVHGALCYCVSGRCYWSSYLGGSSGLRGRCVQPCRRQYMRGADAENGKRGHKAGQGERLFSCQDLELAPVIKNLFSIPNLASWKIEGRKKTPHYVYHTVTAYKILRDHLDDEQQRKMALEILDMALDRPGVRARFFAAKKTQPMAPGGQTASGKMVGKIHIGQNGVCSIKPWLNLLPRDLLRIGVQDEKWHFLLPITRPFPKGAPAPLKIPKHKTPKAGTPVYLIDRKEPEFLRIIASWQKKLAAIPLRAISDVASRPVLQAKNNGGAQIPDMDVYAQLPKGKWQTNAALSKKAMQGIWLNRKALDISPTLLNRVCFWLPPAIWPDNEPVYIELVHKLIKKGARHFVCNAPWQSAFFENGVPGNIKIIAGPFCNLANSLAIGELALLGFCAAFISPELSAADILALPAFSPLPLGIILGGVWPVGISRFGVAGITAGEAFTSPKGEVFWSKDRFGMTWIYPAWKLDISEKKYELEKAGYKFFGWLNEETPKNFAEMKRPGLFNWDGRLL